MGRVRGNYTTVLHLFMSHCFQFTFYFSHSSDGEEEDEYIKHIRVKLNSF